MTRSSKCRARAPRRVFSLLAVVVGCVGISGSYACYSSTEAASPVEASDAGGAEGGALSFDAAREDDASSGHPPPDSGVDAGAPVVVCTSGTTWAGGDHGSAVMHPGEACIACHTTDHGPKFAAAGTVFPTSHEPDDCNGSNLSGPRDGQDHRREKRGDGHPDRHRRQLPRVRRPGDHHPALRRDGRRGRDVARP